MQVFEQAVNRFGHGQRVCIEMYLGCLRIFVGAVDAGKLLDFTPNRFFVESFRVATFADFERRIDENLNELALGQYIAHDAAIAAEGSPWR